MSFSQQRHASACMMYLVVTGSHITDELMTSASEFVNWIRHN